MPRHGRSPCASGRSRAADRGLRLRELREPLYPQTRRPVSVIFVAQLADESLPRAYSQKLQMNLLTALQHPL